jgi:hypothetical protein
MRKLALFAFNGEPMCFAHVLLNGFDLQARGHEVAIVIEGSATRLVQQYAEDPELPFAGKYREAVAAGLVHGVCKACAAQMGSLAAAEEQGLSLLGEMNGHPPIGAFLEQGYDVLTF